MKVYIDYYDHKQEKWHTFVDSPFDLSVLSEPDCNINDVRHLLISAQAGDTLIRVRKAA